MSIPWNYQGTRKESRQIFYPLTLLRDETVEMKSEINYASLFYPELNRGKKGFHIHHPGAAGATFESSSSSLRFGGRVSLHHRRRSGLIKPDKSDLGSPPVHSEAVTGRKR